MTATVIRRFKMVFHLRETLEEKNFNMLVPVGKFAEHLRQQPGDFLFRQGHDPRDDPPRDVVGGGTERAEQHARTIRSQRRPDAFGVESGGFQSAKVSPAWTGKRALIPV